jgi:hypothetical protein
VASAGNFRFSGFEFACSVTVKTVEIVVGGMDFLMVVDSAAHRF